MRGGVALVAAAALGVGAGAGTMIAVTGGTTTVAQTAVAGQQVAARVTSLTAAQIYAQAAPGVVDITVTTIVSDPFGRSQSAEAEGSGFVIDKNGNIVTSAHVVSDADSITVKFKDGTKANATLVGTDASTDLAVIHVSVAASKLKPLTLADSTTVKVGDAVVAIGSPYGYPESMTAGIVSALGRTIEAPNGAAIRKAIQTDAAINSGNSGGPLIDLSGEVIGLNAQIASGSGGNDGVGFAIPSNTVKAVVTQLLASKGL
jgi:putative serine protease PepD